MPERQSVMLLDINKLDRPANAQRQAKDPDLFF